MNRRSLGASVFGLSSAVVVAVACGGKSTPPAQPVANGTVDPGGGEAGAAGVPAGVTDGALWTCQIEDYDPQPCKFYQEGGEWHLTKLMGSQRFTGVVGFGSESFQYAGKFFCPWGECDAELNAEFTREGPGYTAVLDESPVKLWWDEELAGEWGGAGYGGLTGHEP